MEKAILINRVNDLTDEAKEYDSVYFGTEFCPWLLPTPGDLKKVSDFCTLNNKRLVLLTPWVTDSGLDAVQRLLSDHLDGGSELEVVVNDIGVMKMISEEFGNKVSMTAGRLLSNQRRDPRTLPLKEIGSDALYDHYQHSSFDHIPVLEYLKSFGVNRVEIDNLVQGIKIPAEIKDTSFSLYYPYNYITVTRNCEFCYENRSWQNKTKCKKQCINSMLELRCDEIDEPLYLKGTAIFIKNDAVSVEDLPAIDRLVYTPRIPI